MTLLAPALAAILAIELVAALLFAVTFVRRMTDGEYGIAALLCVAAGEHAWGSLMRAHATQVQAVMAADRAAWLGLVAAIPLSLHFGLAHRGIRPTLRWLGVPYALAVVGAGVDLRGLFEEHGVVTPRSSGLLVGAVDGAHHIAPLGPLGVLAHVALALAAAATVTLTARAHLAGRREGLPVVIGATMFLAAAIHDTAVGDRQRSRRATSSTPGSRRS